jgi:hypothetical protein
MTEATSAVSHLLYPRPSRFPFNAVECCCISRNRVAAHEQNLNRRSSTVRQFRNLLA